MRFLLPVLIAIAMAHPTWASEKAIREAYTKASEAVGLKFVAGLLSIRDLGFEAYNAQGQRIDISLEPTRYELMFKSALAVQLKTQVLKFERLGPDRYRCDVQQDLIMTKVDPKGGKPIKVVLQTRSLDDWVRRPRGWRQSAIRTQQQDYVEAKP